MPRRKKNILNDIIEISSQLPWWAGLGLAIISYTIFSNYSSQEIVTVSTSGANNFGSIVSGTILKALAMVAQYLLPFAFILGAGTSALQQHKRSNLLKRASSSESKTAIDSMSWREFEIMVGAAFRQRGFKVKETPFGPDGGVDLVLTKNDQKILVQCKHWKTQKVGVKKAKRVRALYERVCYRSHAPALLSFPRSSVVTHPQALQRHVIKKELIGTLERPRLHSTLERENDIKRVCAQSKNY